MTNQQRADLYAHAMRGLAHPIRRNIVEDPETGFLAFVENRPYADRDRRMRQFEQYLETAGFAVVAEGRSGADVIEVGAGEHSTEFLPDYSVSLLIDPRRVPAAESQLRDLAAEAFGRIGQQIG